MKPPDSIELEYFRQLLVSIPEEMGAVLRKTAFSANIKERRDYSCALYDAAGETVAMGDHMPVHLGAMPMSVRSAIDAFELRRGDVALLNDPFQGGTHLPDLTAVEGVFVGRAPRPAFYVASRAHHADVGGMSPGSMPLANEIYQEGLRIPPVLLIKQGRTDPEMMRLILANVRTPEEREGDLLAQIMALDRGRRRILDLATHYGLPRLHRNIGALQDYGERMMRAALSDLPGGSYEFEDFMDSSAVDGAPVRIAIRIKIHRDSAVVDFSGSSPQAPGPINANLAITNAATLYVFRCLLADDVPATSGLMRPIQIVAPARSIVNASPPAAMAAGNVETSQRITDVLLGALARAIPSRIPAASSGTMSNLSFGGLDTRSGRPFAYYETIAGGMGASESFHGQSAVHTHMTNSWNTPVEALEHQFPVRISRYRVRRQSGGRGRTRGGDGILREFEFLSPVEATVLADRRHRGPYGLLGGGGGTTGKTTVVRKEGEYELPGMIRLQIASGERLRVETPGGGAFGIE